MTTEITGVHDEPASVATRSIHAMATGTRADFDEVIQPDAVDRENRVQPPQSRVRGPAGFHATALWLRAAFAGLRYDVHHVVVQEDLVVIGTTMNGKHVAPFVIYTDEGAIETVFPPTGKTFAMAQTHWFQMRDGKVAEHWAIRDEMGMAKQLGWLPPTPTYLFRMALAKRKATRAGL